MPRTTSAPGSVSRWKGLIIFPFYHLLTPELPWWVQSSHWALPQMWEPNWNREIPDLRTKGEYFGNTSLFFLLNSLPDNIPALKPPASLASLTACVGHLWIFQLPGCPWQWDHSAPQDEHWKTAWIPFFPFSLQEFQPPRLGNSFLCWHSPEPPHEVLPEGFFMDTSHGFLHKSPHVIRGELAAGF